MYSAFYKYFLIHLNLCERFQACKYKTIAKKKQFALLKLSKLRDTLVTFVSMLYVILFLVSFCCDRIQNGYHFIKLIVVFGILAYRVTLFNASFPCYSVAVHIELINYLNRAFKFEESLESHSYSANAGTLFIIDKIEYCKIIVIYVTLFC